MLAAFLTTILFSISGVCAQRTSKLLGGVEANFWRVMLATALLAAWAFTLGQGLRGAGFQTLLWSGALGFGLGDVALYQALPRIGSRLSILLVHCLAAPVAAAAEWLWLENTLSAQQMLGAALILGGVALALAPGKHLEIPRRMFVIGVICGIIAAIGQGGGALLSRVAAEQNSSAATPVDGLTMAFQRIIAGLVVAAAVFAFAKIRTQKKSATADAAPLTSRRVWPWVVANALSGPAIGVGCYQWALMQQKAGVVLPIVALTPLVIIPLSHFVEGERPRKRSLVGGMIAVAGVVVLRLAQS
jgi:drug/metabolite transporter (DMT)-like permease